MDDQDKIAVELTVEQWRLIVDFLAGINMPGGGAPPQPLDDAVHEIADALDAGGQTRPVRCVCGYGPTAPEDLEQHILASMHLPGDHAESRA